MNHIASSTIILIFSTLLMSAFNTSWSRDERALIWLSYLAHIASAFALLAVYTYIYNGKGDIFAYEHFALGINEVVRADIGQGLPELLRAFLRFESTLDPFIYSPGSSTGAMSAATAIGFLFTGDSLVGCCLLFAILSFSSKVALYFTLKPLLHHALRRRILIGILLVPSAIFWTAGVVKEALAFFGLGWTVYGLSLIASRKRLGTALACCVIGITFIISIKPYILMPLGVSSGLFFTAARLRQQNRSLAALLSQPLYLVMGVGIMFSSIWLLGELFPRFSVSEIASEAARLQAYGQQGQGGSSFTIGSAEATSLSQQLTFAPLALMNSLFRPFIFEVHNAVALINGLETAAISILLGIAVVRRGIRGTLSALFSVPSLLFLAAFVALFGLGVGLGTTNLGTLSRYRVPMMPFYVTMLLLLVPFGMLPFDRSPTAGVTRP